MIVEHRLRKFEPDGDETNPTPKLLRVSWFKTRELAMKATIEDAGGDVVWVGDTGMSETHTYDIKRFELEI